MTTTIISGHIKQMQYCEFFDEPCKKHKCPSFTERRRMTEAEMDAVGPYSRIGSETMRTIHNWCNRYNKTIHVCYFTPEYAKENGIKLQG